MSPEESQDKVDAEIAAALAGGADADWLGLWDAVDVLAEEFTFATWSAGGVVGTTVRDGVERQVYQLAYPVYADSVNQVWDRLGALGLIVVFDWTRWDGVGRYRDDKAALAAAPVGDAIRLLSGIIRSERFVDGAIEGALSSGLMQAALARLRRWYDLERTSG